MAPARLRFRLAATAPLVAGLLLRLWFIAHEARITGDTLVYGDIARNLIEHGIYGFTHAGRPPDPTLIRLPGYPLFLAACFPIFGMGNYHSILFVQCLADLATCALVAALAARLFGPCAGLLTLWLAALCPFTADYVAAPLTETLTLLTIAVAFYGVTRWQDARWHDTPGQQALRQQAPPSTAIPGINRWLFITAVALACSILLRPDQGLLAASILPALLWIGLRTQPRASLLHASAPALIAALCIVAALAPWTIRNYKVFHVFQPLAPRYATDPGETVPLGFQRWYRTWAVDFISTDNAYWKYDGDTISIADLPTRAFDSAAQYDQTAALLDEYNNTTTASTDLDRRFAAIARDRVNADPIRYYLVLPAARLCNMIFRPRTEMLPLPLDWWRWRDHPRRSALVAALGALNFAYVLLALAGLYRWCRLRWHGQGGQRQSVLAWSFIGFILLRSALLLTVDNSEPRYTLEFFPVLLIWAGALFSPKPQPSPPLQPAGSSAPRSSSSYPS